MAGKKKTMGRGLGTLLDRRSGNASSRTAARAESATANTRAEDTESDKQTTITSSVAVGRDALPAESVAETDGVQKDKLRLIDIDQIERGTYQPRRHFDAELLQELADSLRSEGLIQPILVRPSGPGKFELIAGERRWRAAQLAGMTEIPAIVRVLEDRSVAAVSLIENIQRKDLNPLEEAEALQRLCEEFGLSHQEVADSVGRSRSAVTNLMRLLDLHDEVKSLVDRGEIDMGHARALLGAPTEDQPEIARRIARQGLTVRAVEQYIKGLRKGQAPTSNNASVSDPDIDRLAARLSEKFGANVSIRHKTSGSGKLEIQYHSMEELDGILNHFK